MKRTVLPIIAVFAALCQAASAADTSLADLQFFKQDVLPILEKRCYECHAHQAKKIKGGLVLDSKSGWQQGGETGAALVPGKPENSLLIKAVKYTDRELRMPPKEKLSDAEIAVLEKWVTLGAPDPRETAVTGFQGNPQDWWAFKPLAKPAIPAGGPANPIDAFVVAKLTEKGLALSPEADRRTLIRRIYFDVIGLAPTPEEIDAFIKDTAPDAYARLVERLLASPHYGEHWARHWLDIVRFAESHGFEMNQARANAWPYRDYAIRAFNDDKPYDQFIREQLAGDALGVDAATGFLVGGSYDQVKSPDPVLTAQQRADELNDMVSVTGATFLGLTVNCARCHNHKFDPIPMDDYYALTAIFQGVQHGERPMRGAQTDERLKMADALKKELAALDEKIAVSPLHAPVVPAENEDRFEAVEAKFLRFTVTVCSSGEPCIDELEVFSAEEKPRNVALASAGTKATASSVYGNGGNKFHQLAHINDGKYGNSFSWISNENGKGWVQLEFPKSERIQRVLWSRDRGGEVTNFSDRLATGYRIEVSMDGKDWRAVSSSSNRLPPDFAKRKPDAPAQEGATKEQFTDAAKLLAARAKLQERLRDFNAAPKVYAGTFQQPGLTYRLKRGDPMQKGEPITPGALSRLGTQLKLDAGAPEQERRVALANWIADPKNGLTARVMANRLWHYHFGTGIVETPSDFGVNGGRPTHPELLDWLASEFVARGWRIKEIQRLILLSATYRQSGQPNDAALKIDSAARLLWRFPPRRMEAEALRDTILSVSGKLDLRMGGPGFDLFVENSSYVKVYNSKTTFGPDEFRRMIYQSKPRVQLDAVFGAFDCPDAGQAAPRRTSSITPLQALNLLNSPFALQQADFFAQRLEREAGKDPAAQARRGFALAFGRDPSKEESDASVKFIQEQGLKMFCRALFNANEFVEVN